MAFPIITADQRLAENRRSSGVILGPAGVGKTTLLKTTEALSALFVDMEDGDLAVRDWPCDTLRPRTWPECRDLACFIGGPNPALRDDQSYSQAHYDRVCDQYGDPALLGKYSLIFVDSITVAGRLCLQWSKGQPQAYSEKTGKPDNRGAYGLHGSELIAWLTQWQHIRSKDVWLVGILDQVISMVVLKADDGTPYRAFVCQHLNPWGYPAKDRSGRLDVVEEPHLGRLISKITAPRAQ